MANQKFDGIIEAVRYDNDGHIQLARVYVRRGAVWSDDMLLTREQLSERLRKGGRFVIGQRKTYLGAVFETGKAVRLSDNKIISGERPTDHDHLSGVPIF